MSADLGGAWWKQRKDKDNQPMNGKDGKPIWNISVSMELPILGKFSFLLVPNDDMRDNEKAPAFRVLWFPDRADGKKAGQAHGGPPTGGWQDGEPF